MMISATSPPRARNNTRQSALAWHALSAGEVVNRLGAGSVPTGLSAVEAKLRLKQFGPNALIAREGVKSSQKVDMDLWAHHEKARVGNDDELIDEALRLGVNPSC